MNSLINLGKVYLLGNLLENCLCKKIEYLLITHRKIKIFFIAEAICIDWKKILLLAIFPISSTQYNTTVNTVFPKHKFFF